LPKLSVVIPTKNEQDAIAGIIEKCRAVLAGIDHEVIVVDASDDNTPAEALRAGAKVVRQIGTGGVGEGLIQGFYWSRGEYIALLDGDGTYDPADLQKVVRPLLDGEADVVNGNRFANMEEGAMPFGNRAGNWILTWVGNLLFHTRIKDSQSGMKAFRRDIMTRVSLWERGFPIISEILAEASKFDLRIVEVGITYRRRLGKSKLRASSEGPRILWAILNMLRDYDPLFLFTMIGLALIAAGFVVAWPVAFEYVERGVFTMLGRALLAILLWLSGLLSIFTGIVLDSINYSLRKIETHTARHQ